MELMLPFSPLERAQEVENVVVDGGKRKYYRFRATEFYRGIATADAVGCCFLCAFCWNLGRNLHPASAGQFYSAEQVVRTVLGIARQKNYNQLRVSGAEPILGPKTFEHLLETLKIINKEAPFFRFILETNGFVIGQNKEFAEGLAKFRNVLVRVSLKAGNEEKFEKLTGAKADFFSYPLQALINLKEAGARFWLAIMPEFFTSSEIVNLKNFLVQNHIASEIEKEELLLYPFVERNLKERGFFPF